MTIQELINYGNQYLDKKQVSLILSTLLDINPLELNLNNNKFVSDYFISKYKKVIDNILNGKPIQYALSNTCFYGYNFFVNENVLIPRFETEELVYYTLDYIKKYFDNPNILDLCTGSGCIGLTLKKECNNCNITLSDISEKALEVAYVNKNKLNISANIVLSDLFENINDKYDVIVSNPPYVAYGDEVDDIVLNNEPHLALYADNNGLEIYERILKDCEKYLSERYLVAFEIGCNQKDDIIKIINKYLENVKIITRKDASNRNRFIFIFKNIDLSE